MKCKSDIIWMRKTCGGMLDKQGKVNLLSQELSASERAMGAMLRD